MLFINLLDSVLAGLLAALALYIVSITTPSILVTATVIGGAVFIYRTVAPFVLSAVIDFFNRENPVA